MTTILHSGILSPHLKSVMRLLWRCDETLQQEHVAPGQLPILAPDIIFQHGFHENPADLERYVSWGVPVVVRPYNDRWMARPGALAQMQALLERCSLVVGSPFSRLKAVGLDVPWQDVTTLVDESVFKPHNGLLDPGPEIRFFAARLLNQDGEGVYWGDEIIRAMAGLDCEVAGGHASPNQMADQLRRSVVVISLCGTEWGPSETTLEAIYCGKVPVLSDIPAIRSHFEHEGRVIGARLATRDPRSIRAACVEVLQMTPEQRAEENAWARERFASWSLQAQQERIGAAVLGLVDPAKLLRDQAWSPGRAMEAV